jgi:hypothetical protein
MTLTEIQNNFTAWRENRSHPKEKIPNELWQQVASVYLIFKILTFFGCHPKQFLQTLNGELSFQ